MRNILDIFHSGGLWAIPFVLAIIGVVILVIGVISSKSNSDQQTDLGSTSAHTNKDTGNVPLGAPGNRWPLVWGIGLIVIAIVIYLWISADYKGV